MEKKRGAPKGNQYARKHGFYSHVLDEDELREYEKAVKIEGLDDEIALLRVKLKSLIERDPENIRLIMQAGNTMVRMIIAKYNISREDRQTLRQAVFNVLRDVGTSAGLVFIDRLLK